MQGLCKVASGDPVTSAVMVSRVGGLLPGASPATAAVTPRTLLVSVAVGIFVAVLAGGGAVRRALRIPPVAALRSRAGYSQALSPWHAEIEYSGSRDEGSSVASTRRRIALRFDPADRPSPVSGWCSAHRTSASAPAWRWSPTRRPMV